MMKIMYVKLQKETYLRLNHSWSLLFHLTYRSEHIDGSFQFNPLDRVAKPNKDSSTTNSCAEIE